MDKEKAKRIRNAHRAFVEKTMEGATRILVEQTADHVEDSSREKLMGLKFTLNERLETIQKLDETILENSKGRDIEKEVEDCGEFCAKVYRILARIDLSLEDAKNRGEDKTWTRGPWTPTLDGSMDHFHGPGPWTAF